MSSASKLTALSAPLLLIALIFGSTQLQAQSDFRAAAEDLCTSFSSSRDAKKAYTAAVICLVQNNILSGVCAFTEILDLTGDSPGIRVLFGKAFRETEHWDEAYREFKRAVALNSDYPNSHYYLGSTLLLWQGVAAFDTAAQEFELDLALDPNKYASNFYLGVIYAMQRNDVKALHYLREAIRIEPSSPDSYLYVGQVLTRSGQPAEAVEALTKSIELNKDLSHNNYQVSKAHYILGQALLKLGNREEGALHIKKSQEIKQVQYQAAQAAFQAKKQMGVSPVPSGMASHDFRDLRDSETFRPPKDPPLSSQAQDSLGNSRDFFGTATAEAFRVLAKTAASQNYVEGAVDYYEKAVRLDPVNSELFRELSLAYTQLGREQEAKAALEKCRELNY
jgi:tetratricopeptide (TPR) repeat protein